MTQLTSIEAYNKAEESGLVSTLRLKVLKILCDHGDLTAGEMRQFAFSESTSSTGKNQYVYHQRLSELQRMGLVENVGTRKCTITGNNAIVWSATGNTPVKYERAKSLIKKGTEATIDEIMEALSNDSYDYVNTLNDCLKQHGLLIIKDNL